MNQQKQETIMKQKNPLRVEQGKRLVEYNRRKKQELKNLNEQITKQVVRPLRAAIVPKMKKA